MKVGDLVKFRWVYSGCNLNGKQAVYMGEDIIRRDDGFVIINHKILEIGQTMPTIIDVGLLKYMEVVNESR